MHMYRLIILPTYKISAWNLPVPNPQSPLQLLVKLFLDIITLLQNIALCQRIRTQSQRNNSSF